MADVDELIRQELTGAAQPADPTGAFERILMKRRARRALRRAGVLGLAVIVVAGSFLGTYSFSRVFRAAGGRGDLVAFVRLLRPCYDHPNVGGGLELFAVDVNTGEQRLLSRDATFTDGTLPSERSPDFSPEGTEYVWVDHYRHDLYLTDLLTGDTRRLTDGPDADRPRFSPDGSTIAFSGTEDPAEPESIYVINPEDAGPVRLTEGSLPVWTPDGRIAFVRTHSRIFEEQLAETTVFRQVAGPTEFLVMNADGSGIQKVFEAPSDVGIVDGEWAPEGERLVGEAVVRGNHDIYVVDLAARAATRLTDHPARDGSPSWSPDGSMIAFTTGRWGTGVGHSEIAVVNADGSGLRRLTNDCWDDHDPTWIPDDRAVETLRVWTPPPLPELGSTGVAKPEQILYSGDVDGVVDLFAIDATGGEATRLTADLSQQLHPSWSPDRTRIAFSGDLDEPGNPDIYVMEPDGTNVRRVTSAPGGDGRPSWSPDGSMMALERDGAIVLVNADGSEERPLTDGSGRDGYPAWSPDGSRIAFIRDGEVHVINADGTSLRRLTETGHNYEVDWSPDGSKLLFTHLRDLVLINADGTGFHNLTAGPKDTYERGGNWSPDGAQIVFASDRQGGQDMHLYVMNADGTRIRRLDGPIGFCCPEPDW